MEDTASLLSLADRMLYITALVSAPVLLASLAVGIVVGVVQAATSVNEQTLTFVPKLAIIAVVLVVILGLMLWRGLKAFSRRRLAPEDRD
jgi:flagellar biosynthetic protein FliQ